MSSSPPLLPVVAIAGATGNLGQYIVSALLNPPFRSKFSRVLLLTRDPSALSSRALLDIGFDGELVHLDKDYVKCLEGVDVFVNAMGTQDRKVREVKDNLLKAAVDAGVSVYIPSEFGIDNRWNDFDHEEWRPKRKHIHKARAYDALKVIAIYNGLFLEDSFGPWFGFDTDNNTYTSVGPPSRRFSLTYKSDVARVVASVAHMAFNSPKSVPNHVRVAGVTTTFEEVKEVMEAASGGKAQITLKSVDLDNFKRSTIEKNKGKGDPAPYLRFLIGEGKIDLSADNANELVNPGQKLWKWRTLKQYAEEVQGRPWAKDARQLF